MVRSSPGGFQGQQGTGHERRGAFWDHTARLIIFQDLTAEFGVCHRHLLGGAQSLKRVPITAGGRGTAVCRSSSEETRVLKRAHWLSTNSCRNSGGGGGDLGPRSRPVPPQGVPRVLTGNLLYLRARRLRGPWVLRGRRRGWNFLERASSHVVPGAPVSESGNLLHGFCFCHLVALWPWVLGSSFGEVGGEKKRSNSRFRSCWGRYSDAHRGKIRRL